MVVQEIEQYFQSLVTEMVDHFAIYTSEPKSDMESMDHMMKFLYWSIYDSDVMNQFVDRLAPSISREITRETVLSWKEGHVSIFQVESQPSEERLEISDMYTGQTYWVSSNTIITDEDQSAPFLMGVLMRWGVYHQIMPVALPLSEFAYNQFSAEANNKQQFEERYLDFLQNWWNMGSKPSSINELNEDPRAIKVLELAFDHLFMSQKINDEEQELLVSLWLLYYERERPSFKKTEVMAAALDYIYLNHPMFKSTGINQITFKEIAEEYGVSASAVSNRVEQLESFIMDQVVEEETSQQPQVVQGQPSTGAERALYELHQNMADEPFDSLDDANEYLHNHINDSFTPKTDQQKAQIKMYDAFDTFDLDEQEKLVDDALQLDPNNIDALVMKAQLSEFVSETYHLMEKAISLGREQIDLQAIYDDEMPWAVIENRPWFRAIEALGDFHNYMEDLDEAVELYEWLLFDLNPNDNQGIRYRLIICYLALNRLSDAKKLLTEYDEPSMSWSLNWAIYYIFVNDGIPVSEVEQSILKAYQYNPKLLDYFVDEDQLYSDDMLDPAYDEIERYFGESGYLWEDFIGIITETLI
ncbi:tetratricopeptide repeat protein [Alkalibacillus almallahensis]|uniref:tetratricopeptide repeat protein n=1 Tax=Alkalibacillus almallahensis TaxID=1379154 RepID=UPI0014213296|nr:tetratricopeptide (TPR) repeat protein [Alkalibacillus almallahensis]